MPEPDLIGLFAEPLNQAGIRYFISGSVAAMLYGEPRLTHDIDLIVFLGMDQAPRLQSIFPTPAFHVPDVSVILEEMARASRGHFNVIHVGSALKADFYLAGGDELHGWAMRNARHYTLGAATVTVAPPEYVIIRKLEYHSEGGSEKHLRDIRAMLVVSGAQLDRRTLAEWVARLRLEEEWQAAQA